MAIWYVTRFSFVPLTKYEHLMPRFWYLNDLYLITTKEIGVVILVFVVLGFAVGGLTVYALRSSLLENEKP